MQWNLRQIIRGITLLPQGASVHCEPLKGILGSYTRKIFNPLREDEQADFILCLLSALVL